VAQRADSPEDDLRAEWGRTAREAAAADMSSTSDNSWSIRQRSACRVVVAAAASERRWAVSKSSSSAEEGVWEGEAADVGDGCNLVGTAARV
jgi:hypothetical protein